MLADRHGISRQITLGQLSDRDEDQLMVSTVKIVGTDRIGNLVPRTPIEHQSAEQ